MALLLKAWQYLEMTEEQRLSRSPPHNSDKGFIPLPKKLCVNVASSVAAPAAPRAPG